VSPRAITIEAIDPADSAKKVIENCLAIWDQNMRAIEEEWIATCRRVQKSLDAD
jgi:hypothetical protein